MFRCIGLICCASVLTSATAQAVATGTTATTTAAASSVPAITINATVEKIIGSKTEDGTLVLKLASDGSFDEQWNLPGQKRSFHAGAPEVGRSCTATDETGTARSVTSALCFQSVPWFAPWIGTLLQTAGLLSASASSESPLYAAASSPSAAAASGAPTASSTYTVYQLAIPAEFQTHKVVLKRARAIASASSMTITSDASTGLPSQATFFDPGGGYVPLQNTVMYSDYSAEGGLMLPHHITRALQGTILYDIHVTSVTLN